MRTISLHGWALAFGACVSCCSAAAWAEDLPVKQESAPVPATGEVVVWDAIPQAERAGLWPLLTHEQRLFQWRYMSKSDRQHLKNEMTDDERRQMKRRYVIDSRLLEAAVNHPQRKLSPEEKRLLREQIMEVHIEIRRGVPYDCLDLADCRTADARIKRAREAARRRAAAETPAAAAAPAVEGDAAAGVLR